MLQKIPKAITTTQLQRNPKVIDELIEKGEQGIIIRDSEQIGVFTPIDLYNSFFLDLRNCRYRNKKEDKIKKENDLKKIKMLAGRINEKFDYTPEELNDIFDNSYEMLS